jgi:hypothetical protein
MQPRENAASPFPPGFVFQDVEEDILAHEDEWAQPTVQPGVWNAYMSKMLSPEQATSRAA